MLPRAYRFQPPLGLNTEYLLHAPLTGKILDSESTSTLFLANELPHSTTSYNPPPRIPQNAPPTETYASYLRSVYTQDKLPVYDKWPGVKSKKYINPVLIGKQPITEQETDDLIRSTVYGNIETIKQTTQKIDIDQIAQLTDESQPKCILVEGAPGVGKSTLAWKLCHGWGKGELLQQYQLVVLLRLRDENVRAAKNISDLFQYHDHQIPQAAVEEIQKTGGEGVLLLFEGYDELPETLRTSSSIFLNVITGRMLHKATVLITSRPWASEFLLRQCRRQISQRIEVMGFSESDIQSYLESITADDPSLLNDLKTYLSCYPHINSLMYSPLNCAIVVEVYRRGRKDNCFVPKTMTDLYSSLVRTLLLRHLFEHDEKRKWRIRSFSDLPSDIYKTLCELGRVAYEGIVQETQVVFSDLPDDFETLGLMNCVSELYVDEGVAVSYNFLHLTVQEYLAAFHLSQQPVEEQIEHFQKYGKQSKQHLKHDDVSIDETSVQEQGSECEETDIQLSDNEDIEPTQDSVDGHYNDKDRECEDESDSGDEDSLRLQLSTDSSSDDLMNYENHKSDGSTDNVVIMTASSSVDVVCSNGSSNDDSGERHKEYIDESASEHSSDSESGDNSMEYDGDSVGESSNTEIINGVNQECGNHFQNVLKFLCGLSKFNDYGEALESLIKVYPDNSSEDGTVTPVVTMNSLHWLFEAQEITKILGSSSVKVDEHTCDITPFECYILGYCVSHSNCRWKIDLKSCGIGDEGVEKIVQGIRTADEFTGSISEINLSDNDITCKGIKHLLNIPKCLRRELETLDISLNDIDSTFYKALSKLISDMHHLKSFNLNGVRNPESMMRGDVICSEFLASLTALRSLEDLNLIWTGIGKDSKDCQALCELLSPPTSLRKLCVSHLPCESVELIINHVDGNTTLESLYMADSCFSLKACNSLALALRRNHTLVDLNLRRSNIDSDGAGQIASALCTNDTVQTLWLEGNSIEAVAAAEFAKMLGENKSLKQLNLQRNPIGEEGTLILMDSLKDNTSLEKLYLYEGSKPVTVPPWYGSRVVFRSVKHYTPL